jgi:hypothetical protein
MINPQKLEEIRYILDKAEDKIAKKSEKILVEMYWEIGSCLKNEDMGQIMAMKEKLASMLNVEQDIFERSYIFYQKNSIKRKALGVVK